MSAQEKRNIVSLFTTLIVSVPYLAYVLFRYQGESFSTAEELKFWATAMLLLIPVRIVAEILLSIVFSIVSAIITGEDDSVLSGSADERDKLIDLIGTRNSSYTFMVGVLLAMVAMVVTESPATMFGIIIFSGFLAEIMEISSKIYYYRKGI